MCVLYIYYIKVNKGIIIKANSILVYFKSNIAIKNNYLKFIHKSNVLHY